METIAPKKWQALHQARAYKQGTKKVDGGKLMALKQKDYELIAMANLNALEDAANLAERAGALAVANNLADRLEQANPKFNRSKFLQACGLEA